MVCPRLSKIMISLCCNRGACFPWHWRCCWKQSKRFQRGGGPRPPKAGHRDPPFARHWNLYLQIRRLRRVYHSDLALCYFVDCRLSYSFHMTWLRNILWWRYQMYEVWLETKSFGFLHCNFPPCFRGSTRCSIANCDTIWPGELGGQMQSCAILPKHHVYGFNLPWQVENITTWRLLGRWDFRL